MLKEVLKVFQGSCRNAKRVLKETSRSFKGCFKHFNEFQYCFRSFKIAIDSRVFQVFFHGCFKEITSVFQEYFKGVKKEVSKF